MEIRQLRYFLAAAREGNVTRAARTLHISQPTLSRQMAQFERELGTALFTHEGKRTGLTDAGLLLRRRAEELLELADKTEREVAGGDREVEGVVSLGCGDLRAVERVAQLAAAFGAQYPLVTFDWHTATADQVLERMERGLADVGLLLEPVDMGRYEFVRVGAGERWVAAVAPDHPLAARDTVRAEDLDGVPLLLPRRAEAASELLSWLAAANIAPCVRATGNLNAANAAVATAGGLCALVVEGSLAHWAGDKIACRPLDPPLRASSVLAWRRDQPLSAAAQRFTEFARAALTQG